MDLSRAVASAALILGVLLVVGHARGGDEADATPAQDTAQKKLEKREEALDQPKPRTRKSKPAAPAKAEPAPEPGDTVTGS